MVGRAREIDLADDSWGHSFRACWRRANRGLTARRLRLSDAGSPALIRTATLSDAAQLLDFWQGAAKCLLDAASACLEALGRVGSMPW